MSAVLNVTNSHGGKLELSKGDVLYDVLNDYSYERSEVDLAKFNVGKYEWFPSSRNPLVSLGWWRYHPAKWSIAARELHVAVGPPGINEYGE